MSFDMIIEFLECFPCDDKALLTNQIMKLHSRVALSNSKGHGLRVQMEKGFIGCHRTSRIHDFLGGGELAENFLCQMVVLIERAKAHALQLPTFGVSHDLIAPNIIQ